MCMFWQCGTKHWHIEPYITFHAQFDFLWYNSNSSQPYNQMWLSASNTPKCHLRLERLPQYYFRQKACLLTRRYRRQHSPHHDDYNTADYRSQWQPLSLRAVHIVPLWSEQTQPYRRGTYLMMVLYKNTIQIIRGFLPKPSYCKCCVISSVFFTRTYNTSF